MSSRYPEGEISLPVGGTTGLDHSSSAALDEAVAWLALLSPQDRPKPIVPSLRTRFGLSASEACAVIREVNLRNARAT